MIVLAAAGAIVLAVVLTLVLTGGSSKNNSAAHTNPGTTVANTTPTTTTGTTGTTGAAGAKVLAQVNLNPPSGGGAKGIAEVLQEAGKLGVAIVAQGLKANSKHDAYAVWLYNSKTDSHLLGFVNPPVSSNGRLETTGALPTNASHFKKLIVTLETTGRPGAPGSIVLEGALSL
jgi:hypothetical protein